MSCEHRLVRDKDIADRDNLYCRDCGSTWFNLSCSHTIRLEGTTAKCIICDKKWYKSDLMLSQAMRVIDTISSGRMELEEVEKMNEA
jgi:hypothetical protein